MKRQKSSRDVVTLDTANLWTTKVDEVKASPADKPSKTRRNYRVGLGQLERGGGHASGGCRNTPWRGTTNQVAGIFPFLTSTPLPPAGVPIGVDLYSGATIAWHPVEWLHRKIVANPNTIATGDPGSGKSTWLKLQIIRQAAIGVSSVVSYDIKGEYNALADWLGAPATILGGGSTVRLNPLDGGPLSRQLPTNSERRRERLAEIHRRRLGLVLAIVEQRIERRVSSLEETALSMALLRVSGQESGSTVRDPVLGEVLDALWDISENPPPELHVADKQALVDSLRTVALVLRNLLTDTLAGLFDERTTHPIDFEKAIQSVDISRLESRGEDAVAIALACLSTWTLAAIEDPGRSADAPARHVITDELWRLLRYPAQIRKLDAELRLSRAQGFMRTLVTHRLSDFEAAALPDLARDIAASCDTRVLFAQNVAAAPKVAAQLNLSQTEMDMVSSWGAGDLGRFLARIGPDRGYVIQTVLSGPEVQLTHTNERMKV